MLFRTFQTILNIYDFTFGLKLRVFFSLVYFFNGPNTQYCMKLSEGCFFYDFSAESHKNVNKFSLFYGLVFVYFWKLNFFFGYLTNCRKYLKF